VLQNQLLIWFIGMLLESLLRLRVAGRSGWILNGQAAKMWASRWVAIAASAGCCGGGGNLFFAPDSPCCSWCCWPSFSALPSFTTLYAGYRARCSFSSRGRAALLVRMVEQHDAAYYSAAIVLFAVFLFTLFFEQFRRDDVGSGQEELRERVLVEQLLNEKRLAEEAARRGKRIRSKTQFFAAPATTCGSRCRRSASTARCCASGSGPLSRDENLSSAVESLSSWSRSCWRSPA